MSPWISGSFKRAGNGLIVLGLLLFLASGFLGLKSLSSSALAGHQVAEVGPTPEAALDVAKKEIPEVLNRIYSALNDGRPGDVAPFVAREMLNTSSLDSLCQPFTHRAHYIASIVERPDGSFLARERVLLKPFNEKAGLMLFKESSGRFLLVAARDDPFTQEQEEAKEAVRQFIFAARAGKWDIVSRYASLHLPIDTLKEPEWEAYLAGITKAEVDAIEIRRDRGIFMRLSVSVRGAGIWRRTSWSILQTAGS
jgi:hypothetical protein